MREHTAYVFDLDGVVRDFAPGDASPAIEAALGLPAGHVAATAFRSELLLPTITGRRSFDEWYAAICAALDDVVPEPARVREHMTRWREHRGNVIDETVERLETLRAAGHRTAAHRAIEADLGRAVARDEVWFTDDRDENVAVAREFGWEAEVFSRG